MVTAIRAAIFDRGRDEPRLPRHQDRARYLSRLLVYWTVLTLGPVFLAASLSISGLAVLAAVGQQDISVIEWHGRGRLGHSSTSPCWWRLFTLLYRRDACQVKSRCAKRRSAGWPRRRASCCFARGFHIYVADLHAYQSIYGALAAVPIMLFWMYLAWAVILGGAELTALLLDPGEAKPAPETAVSGS